MASQRFLPGNIFNWKKYGLRYTILSIEMEKKCIGIIQVYRFEHSEYRLKKVFSGFTPFITPPIYSFIHSF